MPRRPGRGGGAAWRWAGGTATGRLHRAAAGDSVRRASHPRQACARACRPTWFRRCWKPCRNLPTLASGKVDRQRLPAPRARPAEERRDLVPPRTALEKQIVAVWEKLFAPTPVSVQDDFFLDLGGHSLLVARMVSELRKSPAFRQLSVLDVYQHPTAEKLAARFAQRQQRGHTPVGTHSTASRSPSQEAGRGGTRPYRRRCLSGGTSSAGRPSWSACSSS